LTLPQKVVLIKTGEKNKEKAFLGYEFSNRRGSEGIHPIQRSKSIDDCTQLYDADTFENSGKASTYIYNAFKGNFDLEIEDNLKENISYQNLVDMLTFDRIDFEKNISLSIKKKVKIESKWELKKFSDFVEIEYGKRIVKQKEQGSIYPVYGGGNETFKSDNFNREDRFIISRFGMSPECMRFVKGKFFLNDSGFTVKPKDTLLNDSYLQDFLFLNQEMIYYCGRGVAQKNIDFEQFNALKIPLPPKETQNKIVTEIKKIVQEEEKYIEKISSLKNEILSNFNKLEDKKILLGNITTFKNGLNYNRQSSGELVTIVGVSNFKDDFSPKLDKLEKNQIEGKLSKDYELEPKDILVVRSNGSARLVGRFLYINELKEKTSFSGFTIRIRVNSEVVNSKFLCHYLKTDIIRNKLTTDSKGSNIKSLNQGLLSSIKIPLPPIKEQEKTVTEIEKLETKIKALEKQIAEIPKLKKAILKKYLE
jgi:restriction endonuclease S subunit